MTLPSSGQISISQINAEFGRGNNLNAYRGTTWYTDAGGSGTFPSGAISMSDFWGKRATSPTFSFTISTNQTNANLRTLAINAGWNQSSAVIATISSGVYVSSSSTGSAALTVNGSWPSGVTLVNNGYIVGMGGAGGTGAGSTSEALIAGSAGSAGGLALSVQSYVTIANNGTIGGGGGGGGGGSARRADWCDKAGCTTWTRAGGGGGGGGRSGATSSGGGAAGPTWRGRSSSSYNATAGSSGTTSSGGSGGAGGYASFERCYGGTGGSGGTWGASGGTGATGSSTAGLAGEPTPGYSGGGAGAAVSGNGYISWSATGTRLGAIT